MAGRGRVRWRAGRGFGGPTKRIWWCLGGRGLEILLPPCSRSFPSILRPLPSLPLPWSLSLSTLFKAHLKRVVLSMPINFCFWKHRMHGFNMFPEIRSFWCSLCPVTGFRKRNSIVFVNRFLIKTQPILNYLGFISVVFKIFDVRCSRKMLFSVPFKQLYRGTYSWNLSDSVFIFLVGSSFRLRILLNKGMAISFQLRCTPPGTTSFALPLIVAASESLCFLFSFPLSFLFL